MAKVNQPTAEELNAVFRQVADTIISDTYQLWLEDEESEDDFEMSRGWVSSYLSIHGGELGERVERWVSENPSTWERVCDEAEVPLYWTE